VVCFFEFLDPFILGGHDFLISNPFSRIVKVSLLECQTCQGEVFKYFCFKSFKELSSFMKDPANPPPPQFLTSSKELSTTSIYNNSTLLHFFDNYSLHIRTGNWIFLITISINFDTLPDTQWGFGAISNAHPHSGNYHLT